LFEPEAEDLAGHIPKIMHEIVAGAHKIRLMLRKDASIERITESLKRRTGIAGQWKGRITSEGDIKTFAPRCVELVPIKITEPKMGQQVRVFFGTLERKGSAAASATPEQAMLKLAKEANLDDRWMVDRSFIATPESPPTVIAKRVEQRRFRQALPDGVNFFIADHIEGGKFVNQHRIKSKGGATPDQIAMMVSSAFTKPMQIEDWAEQTDGVIHVPCSRLDFGKSPPTVIAHSSLLDGNCG
jgi:hypothetical protein